MDTQRSSDYADRLEREALDIKNSARKTRRQADRSAGKHSYAGTKSQRHTNEPVHKETRANALRRAHIAKMRASKAENSANAKKQTPLDQLHVSAQEYNSVHVDRYGNVSVQSPRVAFSGKGVKTGRGQVGTRTSVRAGALDASLDISGASETGGDVGAFMHSAMYPRNIVERGKLARIIERVGVDRGIIQKQEKAAKKRSRDSRPRSRIDEYYIAQKMERVRNVGQKGKEHEVTNASVQAEQERRTPRKRSAVKKTATAMERRQSQLVISPERQAGLFKVYEAEVVAEVARPKTVRGLGHGIVNGQVSLPLLLSGVTWIQNLNWN